MAQCFECGRRLTGDEIAVYRKLVDRMAEKTTLYHMYCNKEPQAALVSYEAMSGRKGETVCTKSKNCAG